MAKYAGSIRLLDRSKHEGLSISERFEKEDEILKELFDKSDNLDYERGEIAGAMLRFPKADGYAIYKVVNDSPLTVQHINCGDGWMIQPAHIRGLRKEDVIFQLKQAEALRKLFGREQT